MAAGQLALQLWAREQKVVTRTGRIVRLYAFPGRIGGEQVRCAVRRLSFRPRRPGFAREGELAPFP